MGWLERVLFFLAGVVVTAILARFVTNPSVIDSRKISSHQQKPRRKEHDSDDYETESEDDTKKTDSVSKGEECKMVLVVRTDIQMGKGKVAAQCGHAAVAAYVEAQKKAPRILRHWETYGAAKIALKCDSEEDMLEMQKKARATGLVARSIQDAGRTQIAAGTRTVLAIGPAPKSAIDKITGHLKLY
ncbi:peptidyl-tRNA hydrolase PTH2-domain-containing protein [Cladochytrium replicatum]|nr:peptidyl-tRNA hydrolase PTH2-domain-containing protein [Cladochytrium replicatum]